MTATLETHFLACSGPRLLALALIFANGCLGSGRSAERASIDSTGARIAPASPLDRARDEIVRGRHDADADTALAAGTSLDDVRALAVRRNPDLRAALERWVAFLERVPQRTSLPYPTLRYGYSSMFDMHSVELMQEVPFPTKLLAEGRAALAEARSMGGDFRERENALRERASAAYAELALARRELAIIDENVLLVERFIAIARAKYAAGTATQPDVLRAEVDLSALRADRSRTVAETEVARSTLNVLLDRPSGAPLGPLAPLPVPETPTAEAPIERALAERPELAAAAERVAAADAMLSRARQEWVPDIAVGGAYVRDVRERMDESEVTGGITLPVWWGRIEAAIAEGEAETRRARAELRATRNRVEDEVRAAWARTRAAAERFRILADEAVPRAEQNVRVSDAAYQAGQIDFLELVDSQRMLLMEQLERERALAEFTIRRAELDRAVGGGVGP